MKRKIYVVSTTHWDREWYSTFQQYRFRLVRMLDDLIDNMEKYPEYKYFHLDGQTIVLDDYLRIRPQNKSRLEKLIKDGRIFIGPWYCMPDEFLISGEGLVRNLQKGREICDSFDTEPMKNGYVCDIFGHNTQMPQIFKNFGMNSAGLFRGVGSYGKDTFLWEGADGTRILTNKFSEYYNYSEFYFICRAPFEQQELDKEKLINDFKAFYSEFKHTFANDSVLLLDGVDHIDMEPELPEIIKILNDNFENLEFIHASHNQFIEEIITNSDKLEVLKAPLYKVGTNTTSNSVLKNVLSSMVHLKQANDYCETNLSLVAEPLDLYTDMAREYYRYDKNFRSAAPRSDYFNDAWTYIIENQPHDSICGCSITNTHIDNEYRFKQAKEIIELMKNDALEELTQALDTTGTENDGAIIIYNPSQNKLSGTKEILFQIENSKQKNFLRIYDDKNTEIPYVVTDISNDIIRVAPMRTLIKMPEVTNYTLALNLDIPPCSVKVLTYKFESPNARVPGNAINQTLPHRYLGSMKTAFNIIDNGKLIIEFKENGTLKVQNKETGKIYDNVLTYENSADIGDGWNYYQPVINTSYLTSAANSSIGYEIDSPDFARVRIHTSIDIPITSDHKKRCDEFKSFEIETIVTIIKNSTQINIKTLVDNKHFNHRLRVLVPTNINSNKFKTLTPFDLCEWNVIKNDWNNTMEIETGVTPNQGLVFIKDKKDLIAIYNKGLYETAVSDTSDKIIALTLFRSFPNEVGKYTSDMGKMQRKIETEYAIDFCSAQIQESEILKNCLAFKTNILSFTTQKKHSGELGKNSSLFKFTGNAVISAIKSNIKTRCGKQLNIIRLYDVDGGSSGSIEFLKPLKKAYLLDLKNDIIKEIEIINGKLNYDIPSKKIITIGFTI